MLNISKLTNKVHEALFSLDALKKLSKHRNSYPLDIGIIPEYLLLKILPEYCTKECLIQLQYCQEISHDNVGVFSSISQSSASRSLLLFPALILGDKSNASWRTPPDNSYSIGWFASCTDPSPHVSFMSFSLEWFSDLPSLIPNNIKPLSSLLITWSMKGFAPCGRLGCTG